MPGMLNRMACGVASALAIKGLRLASRAPAEGGLCWPYVRLAWTDSAVLALC